jgi:hypothetical protein
MSESERVEPVLFDLGGVLMDFTGLRRFAVLCGVEMGVFSMGAFEPGHCDGETFGAGVEKTGDWISDRAPKAPNNIARYSGGTTKPAHCITARLCAVLGAAVRRLRAGECWLKCERSVRPLD